jgi:hypothetical protein
MYELEPIHNGFGHQAGSVHKVPEYLLRGRHIDHPRQAVPQAAADHIPGRVGEVIADHPPSQIRQEQVNLILTETNPVGDTAFGIAAEQEGVQRRAVQANAIARETRLLIGVERAQHRAEKWVTGEPSQRWFLSDQPRQRARLVDERLALLDCERARDCLMPVIDEPLDFGHPHRK